MDIIDFRYRPPYGSYRETIMYRDLERARRCSEAFGMTQSPAVAARDMEASLTEMDRAGIGMAVLAGRKVLPHIGIVDNQDIVDLIHAYPGRFTGMAGVDPGGHGGTGAVRRGRGPAGHRHGTGTDQDPHVRGG